MSNPAVQLTFTLRTSPNVRTVHLLGSWDNYKSQLPLSAVKDSSAKPGSWKGTFRFQGAHALKLGSRYWYYYIVDGYHVSHDPAKEYTTEKTTGRKLNILDVPGGKSSSSDKPSRPTVQTRDLPGSKRHSRDVPQGRALSPSKIMHPKPSKPYASRHLREADYETSPVDELEDRFAATRISDRHAPSKYSSSPSELSDDSSSSGTAFSRSSPSSLSSLSDRSCRCERYGVTRSGQRVKLDCGGKRCGYSGSSSECSSESSDSEEEERYRASKEAARRREAPSGGRHDDRRREAEPRYVERRPARR
jgi:hypothetical protein